MCCEICRPPQTYSDQEVSYRALDSSSPSTRPQESNAPVSRFFFSQHHRTRVSQPPPPTPFTPDIRRRSLVQQREMAPPGNLGA